MNLPDFCGALCAAMLMLWVSGTANAESSYLEQNGYDEALNRCFDLLRPALAADDYDTISWVINEIELQGPWYHFEIEASLKDANGAVKVDGFRVGCRSNRWISDARLLQRPNEGVLPPAYEVLALN